MAVLLLLLSLAQFAESCALSRVMLFFACNTVSAAFIPLPIISISPAVPGALPSAMIVKVLPAESELCLAVWLSYSLVLVVWVLASSVPILINEPLLLALPVLLG